VALGRGGIKANKREGDGGTPRGTFYPRRLWWRADRHRRPRTFLAVRPIRPEDAWCEDPEDRHYNQPVRLDRDHGGDRLTRDDHLYDFIVEIDHNAAPRIAGRGTRCSCIWRRTNFSPYGRLRLHDHDFNAAIVAAAWSANQNYYRMNVVPGMKNYA